MMTIKTTLCLALFAIGMGASASAEAQRTPHSTHVVMVSEPTVGDYILISASSLAGSVLGGSIGGLVVLQTCYTRHEEGWGALLCPNDAYWGLLAGSSMGGLMGMHLYGKNSDLAGSLLWMTGGYSIGTMLAGALLLYVPEIKEYALPLWLGLPTIGGAIGYLNTTTEPGVHRYSTSLWHYEQGQISMGLPVPEVRIGDTQESQLRISLPLFDGQF